MRSIFIFLLFFGYLTITIFAKSSDKTNLIFRVNENGKKFGAEAATRFLTYKSQQWINRTVLPDQNIETGIFVLTTRKAIIREFEAPSFYTESTDNGIILKLDKFIVDIHADMEFSFKNLFFGLPIWPLSKFNIGPKIWYAGKVIARLRNGKASALANFQQKDGYIGFKYENCNVDLSGLDIEFPSKIPFFLDIFGGVINRVVQNLLRTEICNSLENVVKPSIFGEHSFPVETQYGDRREYLVQTPLFNVLHTERFSEAQFAFNLQFLREKCPYEAPKYPRSMDTTSHINFWLSEQSLNCDLYALYRGNFLTYLVTKDRVRLELSEYLRTTCYSYSNYICMQTFWPDLARMYPNQYLDIYVQARETPKVVLADNIAHMTGELQLDFHTHPKSNGSLATLMLTFSCDLSGRLNRTVLLGGISNIQADIRQTHSVIGYLYPERLQTFKNTLISAVERELNRIFSYVVTQHLLYNEGFADTTAISAADGYLRLDLNFVHGKFW